MSFALYNKMKTIESSRRELKNILNDKGLDTTHVEALGSLVGMVGQLEKPEYYTAAEDIWEGITRREEPTQYYTGEDDWKSVIDMHSIMENDEANYTCKSIFIIRVSDNPEPTLKLSTSGGTTSSSYDTWKNADIFNLDGTFCKFSDSDDITTISDSTTHTWDESKDLVASNGERFRYIIFYKNSALNFSYLSTSICFEAVYFYKGAFNTIYLFGSGGARYNESRANYNNTVATPKYIELNSNASISNLSLTPRYKRMTYYQSRLKSLVLLGNVTSIIGPIHGKNIEFVKYTGSSKPNFEFVDISNKDISTYIYLKNVATLAVRHSHNVDIYADNITTIGSNVQNCDVCYSLYTNATTSISANAFASNNNHIDIDLKDVGNIGESAFLNLRNGHLKIGSINGTVDDYAFYGSCLNQDIVFGPGCAELNNAIFAFCNVQSIDLSNSSITTLIEGTAHEIANKGGSNYNYLANVGGTFRFCYSMKSLKLPQSLKSISNYALRDCRNLEIVELASGITTIGSSAFLNCEKLTAITLPDTITSLGGSVFQNCKSLEVIKLSNNLVSLPERVLEGCKSLKHIALPSNLVTLGAYSFAGCTSLTHVDLPANILVIPSRCFDGCTALTTITCTEGHINTLNSYAFANCENLEELFDISEVLTAGVGVFMNCKKLVVKCPKAMTAADINIFAGNNNFIDFSNFESCNNTTLYLRGSNWNLSNILKFLDHLPSRTSSDTVYTLKLGPAYAKLQWLEGAVNDNLIYYNINNESGYTAYEKSIYTYYSSKYVAYKDDDLVWAASTDEGAMTVAAYVASKNWTII